MASLPKWLNHSVFLPAWMKSSVCFIFLLTLGGVLEFYCCEQTPWPRQLLQRQQHLIGADLQVQRCSPFSSRWEHGNIQTDMGKEELKVLHLHPKAPMRLLASRQLGEGLKAHTHSDTPTPRPHLLSRATPSNSATPWFKHIQTITDGYLCLCKTCG